MYVQIPERNPGGTLQGNPEGIHERNPNESPERISVGTLGGIA